MTARRRPRLGRQGTAAGAADELGIPSADDDPLLVHVDGTTVERGDVRVHIRRARTVRVSIDANGEYCRQLLAERYGLAAG